MSNSFPVLPPTFAPAGRPYPVGNRGFTRPGGFPPWSPPPAPSLDDWKRTLDAGVLNASRTPVAVNDLMGLAENQSTSGWRRLLPRFRPAWLDKLLQKGDNLSAFFSQAISHSVAVAWEGALIGGAVGTPLAFGAAWLRSVFQGRTVVTQPPPKGEAGLLMGITAFLSLVGGALAGATWAQVRNLRDLRDALLH